ncbi:unnamed protein product [Danaus chrysippus]|uniref:(African queen) hypothetical protein n=1 Tax=Danaus chrysippus TaxID=151541 RepID=A0A8J2QX74_9NEOP|nr:unnamed protein product [Danaus chrysippus]
MKCFIVCSLLVVSCLAEPPVNNRYLPPQARNASPSQSYGVPGFSQRQTEAVFRGRPSSAYGPPASIRKPNSQYGLPKTPSSQYGAPNNQYQGQKQAPTGQYLPPTNQYQTSENQYSAPSQYQAPKAQYLPHVNQYQASSTQYGAPDQAGSNGPSQEYGAPGFERSGSDNKYDNQQSRQYLPPSARGYDDGSSGEPANYDFEYMVQDAPSGNDFGHRESRRGDRAEGVYYVLLPDGRKQTVEYEADQDGFKPRISYEDVGAGSGYDSNRQADYNNDYNNGPY